MIIAFTGAGISKESGIDTFQDRPGIRDKLTRTYAKRHPSEFRKVMEEFVETIEGKLPNDAHYALAEYDIPVITMNVDKLHQQAGTKNIIEVHGRLPSREELPYCDTLYNCPVLYEDPAPMYEKAFDWVWMMNENDILLVIGASTFTRFSQDLRDMATSRGASVVEIQDNASIKVKNFLKENKNFCEDFSTYIKRFENWYH